MSDPRSYDPRDPARPGERSPYSDPAAEPPVANQTIVQPSGGRGGLIAAAVIAVLLVIALIAFTAGPSTDPGTTAVIPDQTETTAPDAAAPEAAPAEPAAPLDDAAPAAPAEPTAPAGEAPAADQ
jgi:hypothetical protein